MGGVSMASLACFLGFEDSVSSSIIKGRFLEGSSSDSGSPPTSIGDNSHPPTMGEVLETDPSSKLSWLSRRMMVMSTILHLMWSLFNFFTSPLNLVSSNSKPVSMGVFSYELRAF